MLVVALPIFNEANGIQGFLHELNENLKGFSPFFVAVDDRSTDNTYAILSKMKNDGFPLTILQNETNKGHGFSVIVGLKQAIELNPHSILLCDGDGQFDGVDVKFLVKAHCDNTDAIVEAVRIDRNDPWFRKLISRITRVLVWLVCKEMPKDANTPLRVLSIQKAKLLLNEIENDCLIPNLAISSFARVMNLDIIEFKARSLPPRRNRDSIDQWKQKTNFLPSKRLLRFVFLATFSWLTIAKNCRSLRKLHAST